MLRKIIKFVVHSSKFIVKEISLCFLSAALLIFSFPGFNFWLLAWFGFVPLFFALKNKSKGKAFLLSYFTGLIFWWGAIYWLVHVTLPGMILLILYLALYFGFFGFILSTSYLLPTTYYLLFIPSIWVLLEYLRSHLFTGFGWTLLGYSQYLNLPIIQVADITGAWGVSFLVMMINVWTYLVFSSRFIVHSRKTKYILFFPFVLFIVLGYGYYKLYHQPSTINHQPVKVSVIQGNIPQELKWDARYRDFILDKHLKISTQATKDKPDLIIWPEASLPVVLEEEPQPYARVRSFVKEVNLPLLLGAVTSKNNFYYNSALLLSDQGKLQDKYDKLHLVPFGEYIPLRGIFSFLETVVPIGDISAGREYSIFSLKKKTDNEQTNRQTDKQTNFSVLICFEDLFPELSREFVKRGADFLVNITNDAWYKKTSAPYQHLQASVFRAIENRVYLARAANTGVSGFIAPTGKIISLVKDRTGTEIFTDGYQTEELVIPKRNLSFYTHFGDVFLIVCFLFILPVPYALLHH